MWKSIVLCISLFGGAALGLALGARYMEPSALPAAAAIGLCLVGVVLILAAPTNDVMVENQTTARTVAPIVAAPTAVEALDGLDLAALAAPPTVVSSRTPTAPFPVLNP